MGRNPDRLHRGWVRGRPGAAVRLALFLTNVQDTLPAWLIALENAVVTPFVAAATFIGSMGNIPLATVLSTNGVLFAGIMDFIYSVPKAFGSHRSWPPTRSTTDGT